MKTKYLGTAILVVLGVGLVPRGALSQCCGDCNDDGVVTIDELIKAVNSALTGCPVTPGTLPVVPEPRSATDILPADSDPIVVGMSNGIDTFEPFVERLEMIQDDGTPAWVEFRRHVSLACPGGLPANSASPANAETYIAVRPRILHSRYWHLLDFASLGPGQSHTVSNTTIYGQSSTDTQSTEFSRTIGVTVSVGGTYQAFSASVEASYEETTTYGEVKSVTFSFESGVTKSYDCGVEDATRVCALWQLVDEFSMVDADMVPIDQSSTLRHAEIDSVPSATFFSDKYFATRVTEVH